MKKLATALTVIMAFTSTSLAVCCCWVFRSEDCSALLFGPPPWNLSRMCGDVPCPDDIHTDPSVITSVAADENEAGWRLTEEWELPCNVGWYKTACTPSGNCVVQYPPKVTPVIYSRPDIDSSECTGG